jgi:transcriptional regulator GlxA family with amidase domain
MEEIRRVKLDRVCSLLAETNLSIGEITWQCGFKRESHLAYLFQKHFAMSMSAYRIASRHG